MMVPRTAPIPPQSVSGRRARSRHMASTLTLMLLMSACGQDAIPTSPLGPEQNALVSVVRVQPSAAVIEPDGVVDLSAIVKSARGQTVNGRPVTWTSSDERVAYVDAQGRIVAGEEGTATIRANVLGVAGQATIDVRGTVTEILIDDPLLNVVEGSQQRFTASFVYTNGAIRRGQSLRWTSVDPSRLFIDGDGDATAREPGEVEIRVSGRGTDGTRRIRVESSRITEVVVRSGTTSLEVGDLSNVWAEVTNSLGERISRRVAWSSSDQSVLSVNTKGRLVARSPGTATISARVAGVSGSLDVTVLAPGAAGGSTGGSGGGGGGATTTAPGTVDDLTVIGSEDRSIDLSFTEVDDGSGGSAIYEIRYGLASGFAWDGGVAVSKGSCAAPLQGRQAGTGLQCSVDGLVASEDYSFQLVAYRSSDGTFGDVSNVADGRTRDAALVVDVTPTAFQIETGESRAVNASITDTYGNSVQGSPTWTTTVSSVATVASAGGSATVSAQAPGNATIRATYNGVSGASAATVTQPITGDGSGGTSGGSGSGGSSTGGTGSTPPPSGQHFRGDFSSFTDDASLHAHAGTATKSNVHAEPGVGMRYDFQPMPTRCGDQSLSSTIGLPSGTKEVWIRFNIRFSGNWDTTNPNCSSPAADYKTVLTWLGDRNAVGGHERFDLKIGQGGGNIHASGPGWPAFDNVPVRVVQQGGARSLFDDRWHLVEMHQKIIGDNEILVQISIDGTVTHNYRSTTTGGLANNWLRNVKIGANRNLGATSLMHVWWDDFEVFVGNDPGGFAFGAPANY